MTVCIAAKCNNCEPACIVSACDSLISSGAQELSGEMAMIKWRPIADSWRLMIAANDLASAEPIFLRIRDSLTTGTKYSVGQIREAVMSAYNDEAKYRIESEILAKYGISLQSFWQEGLAKFGPELFGMLSTRIRALNLDVDFLVYGFDLKDNSHIFTISSPLSPQEDVRSDFTADTLGYGVIGSGATVADGTLIQSKIRTLSFDALLFRVCDAMFRATAATRSVGAPTYAFVIEADGTETWIGPNSLGATHKAWAAKQPEPDPGLVTMILGQYEKQRDRQHPKPAVTDGVQK